MLYQVNESSFVFSLLFYRNGRWGHIEFSVWMVVRSNNCTLSKSLLFLQSMICEVMLWVVRTVQCEFALHTVCIWTETCGQTAKIKFVASSETKTVMSTEISNFQLPTEYRSIKSTMLFALCVIKAENAYALHADCSHSWNWNIGIWCMSMLFGLMIAPSHSFNYMESSKDSVYASSKWK